MRTSAFSQYTPNLELLELVENLLWSAIEPPPSYEDSINAAPPQYILENPAVEGQLQHHLSLAPANSLEKTTECDLCHMTTPGVDFGDTSNFRQVAKKKKTKGGQNQGTNSGDEGNKEGAGDEDNGGGGHGGDDGFGGNGGGGGNNGDGGAGDGGGDEGGGGGGDGWNTGKKKKNKKGKAGVDEEEEKKKKEEEEKKKEEKKKEQEKPDNAVDSLSWANDGDANPDDEWGGFTEKKNKKGKKGKVGSSLPKRLRHPLISELHRLILSLTPKSLQTHHSRALLIMLILILTILQNLTLTLVERLPQKNRARGLGLDLANGVRAGVRQVNGTLAELLVVLPISQIH